MFKIKKYICNGQYIISPHDGQKHFISAIQLTQLYRIDPSECFLVNENDDSSQYLIMGLDRSQYIDLYPNAWGNYNLADVLIENHKRKEFNNSYIFELFTKFTEEHKIKLLPFQLEIAKTIIEAKEAGNPYVLGISLQQGKKHLIETLNKFYLKLENKQGV